MKASLARRASIQESNRPMKCFPAGSRKWIGTMAVLATLWPRAGLGDEYTYDPLDRLTRVEYDSGVTITYEYDASGNVTRRCVAAVPLDLAVGLFQNPYLTQFVDIHVVGARALEPSTIRLQAAGTSVPVTAVGADRRHWKGDWVLRGPGGAIRIEACATGLVGPEECTETDLQAGFVTAAAGGALHSSDGRLRLKIGPGSLGGDGWVLVMSLDAEGSPTRRTDASSTEDAPLLSYRVSPAGPIAPDTFVEISYAGLDLPEGTSPDQLFVERLGDGGLESWVDVRDKVVRAGTSRLGDFVLRAGPRGTSRAADPRVLHVAQNVPNPFNPSTRIRIEVQTRQRVVVNVFDVRGRRVASLLDAMVAAGPTSVVWDGRDARGAAIPSGVYFARVRSERSTASIRMVMLR
jgi:YD repeat-containing protein